jgi:polar amino acid transport system substrate-binding protein
MQKNKSFLIFTILLFIGFPVMAKECLSMHVIDFPPAGFKNKFGKLTGIHVDFLEALQERSGICIDKKIMTYSRALKNIKMGKHDAGILNPSSDLDFYVDVQYIVKLITLKTIIIPKKGLGLNSYKSLQDITIGKVRGTPLGSSFDEDKHEILELTSYGHGLNMLKRGRIDALAGNAGGMNVIGEFNLEHYFNVSGKFIIGQREIWLVFSKNSDNLDQIKVIQTAAQALVDEGIVELIFEKFVGKNWKLLNE